MPPARISTKRNTMARKLVAKNLLSLEGYIVLK
jgi:hypothetical protein